MVPRRVFPVLASLLILGATTATPLHAQAVGFHLGASRATMQFDPVPEGVAFEPRYGLAAGLAADFAFNRSVGLSVRGSYTQKGSRGQWTEEGVAAESVINADYIELSALLTARPGGGPLRLLAGPAMAIAQKCSASVTASFGGQTESNSWQCGDEDVDLEAGTDLGLMLGAGVAIGGGVRYSLDLLYTLGLSDAFASREAEEDSERHRVATLVAGVSFPLRGR